MRRTGRDEGEYGDYIVALRGLVYLLVFWLVVMLVVAAVLGWVRSVEDGQDLDVLRTVSGNGSSPTAAILSYYG